MARPKPRNFKALTKKYKNLQGFEELEAKLNELATTANKTNALRYDMRGVLQKAGLHIRDAALSYAPAKPSNIKQAIVSAFGKDKRTDPTTVVMALFKVSPWWNWWEFGTSGRHTSKGAYRGFIKPVKFLRRGVTTARGKVAAEVASGMKEILQVYGK